MRQPIALVLSGSTRTGSIHRRLAVAATTGLTRRGVDARLVDLRDHPMPLFDADLLEESGPPAAAHELRALIGDAEAVIIASPEYNGAMTPLLKNTVDWVSRVDMFTMFGKLIGLLSASPGKGGGAKVLAMTQSWLASIGARPFEQCFSLPQANEAFVDDQLTGEASERFEAYLDELATWLIDELKNESIEATDSP